MKEQISEIEALERTAQLFYECARHPMLTTRAVFETLWPETEIAIGCWLCTHAYDVIGYMVGCRNCLLFGKWGSQRQSYCKDNDSYYIRYDRAYMVGNWLVCADAARKIADLCRGRIAELTEEEGTA